MKSIIAITLGLLSAAYAQPFSEFASGWWDKVSVCHSECDAWVSNMNSCMDGLNQTYSISVNPSDVSTFAHSGDLGAVAQCACSNEAVGASDSCLVCVSSALCLTRTLSQSDYWQTCQNPMYAWESFKEWHSGAFCENSGSGGSGGSDNGGSNGGAAGGSDGGSNGGSDNGSSSGGSGGSEEPTSSSAPASSSTPCSRMHHTRRR